MSSVPTVLVVDDSPTILKVVQLVLTKAGLEVRTAPDGEAGLAAAREQKPDLILLDFVMPRMNGYQVCRSLAQDESLSDVPVILMSAKGDQVGERFVKVMGIVDYITKPFSPEAITAVVHHSLEKYAKLGHRDSEPLIGSPDQLAENLVDETGPFAREAAERAIAIEELRDGVAGAVAGKISGLFSLADAARGEGASEGAPESESHVPTDADAIADAARAALDDETLLRLADAARRAVAGDERRVLSGNLQVVPIAEILQLLDAQHHTGVLTARRSGGHVDIYFRDGSIDLAMAQGAAEEFLLGRFIVENDLMPRADFDSFVESREKNGKLIGMQLVKLGYITEDDLGAALRQQTCELVYELLRWKFGAFEFQSTRDLPQRAVDAALGLDVEGILMEGFRRVDEWHLIERQIDNFDLVFLRNEDAVAQMGRGRLTREELTVLEKVNGKNTVKELVRESRMGSFEVSKMLYRLLSIGLIRRRVMPVAV